jgi:hypothetical protein
MSDSGQLQMQLDRGVAVAASKDASSGLSQPGTTMTAMTIGWDAAEDIDWSRMSHAYGAATDTPAHLRALVSGDTVAQQAALDHLWAAVIHQGTPWTVTPVAALVVAGLLPHPALSQPVATSISAATGWPPLPLRAELLRFLAEVAEAMRPDIAEDELAATACPPGRTAATQVALDSLSADTRKTEQQINELIEALQNRVILDLRAAAPALFDAVASCLTDGDPRVRLRAAHAASLLATLPHLAAHRVPLAVKLEAAAHLAGQRDEKAALVLALGALGATPRQFLADPDVAVRTCAALAPALAQDAAATAQLLTALADAAALDTWFMDRPPQFWGRVRFTLLEAALARVDEFEPLLPAAIAVAALASPHTANADWGPLLRAAFPDPGDPPRLPAALTPAQRDYLRALVDNPDLWRTWIGNAEWAFHRVGLPYDRDACRKLAR